MSQESRLRGRSETCSLIGFSIREIAGSKTGCPERPPKRQIGAAFCTPHFIPKITVMLNGEMRRNLVLTMYDVLKEIGTLST